MSYRSWRKLSILEVSHEWDFCARFWDRPRRCRYLTNCAESETEAVSDRSFDHADHCHLQSRCPPGADGDERFQGADCEMRDDADDKRGDDCRDAAHKKERDDWDE